MKNNAFLALLIFTLTGTYVLAADPKDIPAAPLSVSTMTGQEVLELGVTDEEWSAALQNQEVNEIHIQYLAVKNKYPNFFWNWNEVFYKRILIDPEMSYFRNRIKLYLFSLTPGVSDTHAALTRHFEKLLTDEIPKRWIYNRIFVYLSHQKMMDSWVSFRNFLGENSLAGIQELVHGGDPFHPTPESLLGKYLAETGAQTVVRKFRTNSDNGPFDGLDRMVVALSQKTLPIYQKYFTRINFFIHRHTPGQGTMEMLFNGNVGSYGRINSPLTFYNQSLLPHVLLTTTEGQRLKQYTELANVDYTWSSKPWVRKGYAPQGGYTSCTHWVGEMPLGDDYVSELKFPGGVDRYADQSVPNQPQIAPITNTWIQDVTTSDSKSNFQLAAGYNLAKNQFDLLRRVWSTPSRKQFSELLGPEELEAAMRGEYANPGWVAIRLTAFVKTERMPVIFYMVSDATQPLNPNFDPNISAH